MNHIKEDYWPQVKTVIRLYWKRTADDGWQPPQVKKEMQAVEEALKWVKGLENGEAVYRYIMDYKIKERKKQPGAAMDAGYGISRAADYSRMFTERVAENLGYKLRPKNRKKQKRNGKRQD